MSQQFARLVGTYVSHSFEHDNGVHLVLNISANGKTYPVDVNIQSIDGSEVEYCQESGSLATFTNGLDTDVTLSYVSDLHLTDNDFQSVSQGTLSNLILKLVANANQVVVYGMMYTDGTVQGLHDIHYNPSMRNQDGALGFVTASSTTWIYCKFQNEHIQ